MEVGAYVHGSWSWPYTKGPAYVAGIYPINELEALAYHCALACNLANAERFSKIFNREMALIGLSYPTPKFCCYTTLRNNFGNF